MKDLRKVLENVKAGDLNAVVEYSEKVGGFYNSFTVSSAPKTKAEALIIVAGWAEKSAEIATSVAKENHGKAAYDAADKAEAVALGLGKSADEVLAAWNEALHAARASAMDNSIADEYSQLAEEVRAAIQVEAAAAKLASETAALEAEADKWAPAFNEAETEEEEEEIDLAALEAELFG